MCVLCHSENCLFVTLNTSNVTLCIWFEPFELCYEGSGVVRQTFTLRHHKSRQVNNCVVGALGVAVRWCWSCHILVH